MKLLNKLINYGLYLFVFLLPWQTRWIYKEAIIKGEVWEYGRWSLYGTEILLIVLLILGVIRWLFYYRRLDKQSRVSEVKSELKGVKLWLIIFVVYSGLTIFWAIDKGLAWYVWLKLVEGIGLFWLIINFKILGPRPTSLGLENFRPKPNQLWAGKFKIQLSLIAAGFIQALLGLYQFLTQSTFATKWLGLALIEPINQGASVIEFLDQRWLRAYGAFPHPNILGGFLAIGLLLVIINLWRLNRSVAESQNIPKKLYWLNIFYWLSAIMMFFALVVTFSRGAWLAFVITLAYLIFQTFKNRLKVETTVTLKLITVFVLVVLMFLVGFPYQLITTRFSPEARLEKYSLKQRMTGYQQAQEILRENSVRGVGLGNYTKALQKKEPNQPGWYYQPVHNWYWLMMLELGFIGLLILGALIVRLLKSTSSINRSLLILILIIALFDHYWWSLYFGVVLWWLVAGISLDDNRHAQSAKT